MADLVNELEHFHEYVTEVIADIEENRLDKAEKSLNEKIEIFDTLPQGKESVLSMLNHLLSNVYTMRNNMESAIEYLNIAINYMEESPIPEPYLLSNLYDDMASIHEDAGEFVAAVQYFEKSFELKKELADNYWESDINDEMDEDFEEDEDEYDEEDAEDENVIDMESLKSADEDKDDEDGLADNVCGHHHHHHHSCGDHCHTCGEGDDMEFDEEQDPLWYAAELMKEHCAMSSLSQKIGALYLAQNNQLDALKYFEKAVFWSEKEQNRLAITQNLLSLTEFLLVINQIDHAKTVLEEKIENFIECLLDLEENEDEVFPYMEGIIKDYKEKNAFPVDIAAYQTQLLRIMKQSGEKVELPKSLPAISEFELKDMEEEKDERGVVLGMIAKYTALLGEETGNVEVLKTAKKYFEKTVKILSGFEHMEQEAIDELNNEISQIDSMIKKMK